MGWHINGSLPPGMKKCILIVAPHTSARDFIIGRFACWYLKIKVKFLIKKEAFKPVLAPIIKGCGGVPVDRSRGGSTVNQVARTIKESDEICIIITPEGTRKAVLHWKKGFYFIALHAEIPIVLCLLDYAKKDGGIGPVLYPTGNFEKDLIQIRAFYSDKQGRYPELFLLPE
jgi:1-acyl-sn-glycerol-3-phosphate acyltransferase